jgi:chromosome segregation ATPase
MERKEATALVKRLIEYKHLELSKSDQALMFFYNLSAELERRIKNDTGYREMKTLYNQIVIENKSNYEKRKELETDVGSEKNISVRWRGMYDGLCSKIHEAVVVGENQERDYPENELKRLTDRKTELEAENTELRGLLNQSYTDPAFAKALIEWSGKAKVEKLEIENTKLRELVNDADEVLSLGNEATEEQHDRAERLEVENARLQVLIKEAHESVEELHGRVERLGKQQNALLAACEAALEKCPFPVGAMKVKQQLKDAILKTK